ncbi:MAG: type VI secretion system protein TssA [bacterium]|nr:type VI secretion system protein TssA [bacterium]
MKVEIDLVGIITPIEGEKPAGADLRYVLYDEITEARRADDALDQGDWQRDIKSADWETVIALCSDALTNRTKDLQIAAWLTEGLTITEGFEGLLTGLNVIRGFLENFWESVHPEIEDDDLDFRIGRLEFLNTALAIRVKQIPLTDSNARAGYSWLQWDESRRAGYEGDAAKSEIRAEMMADGQLTAEDFDAALAASARAFYESLAAEVTKCSEEFATLEQLSDEKFGDESPRLAELRKSLEDCNQLVSKILKEKRALEPDEPDEPVEPEELEPGDEPGSDAEENSSSTESGSVANEPEIGGSISINSVPTTTIIDSAAHETALWRKANELLKASGIKSGLQQLLVASSTAPSVRQRNRYRLLMAKLCLKANRPDLAKPILEELYALIEEISLERWEAPSWIADVLEALYQCLTAGDANDDPSRAGELFRKMCTLDVTKAMIYNQQT